MKTLHKSLMTSQASYDLDDLDSTIHLKVDSTLLEMARSYCAAAEVCGRITYTLPFSMKRINREPYKLLIEFTIKKQPELTAFRGRYRINVEHNEDT